MIQELCNHWCMLLYPNKTNSLVTSICRSVNTPNGDLVFFEDSIHTCPNLDILGIKFDSMLTFEDHVRGIVSRVSQRIGILSSVIHIFLDTSVLLCCYYAFVLLIFGYGFPVWR